MTTLQDGPGHPDHFKLVMPLLLELGGCIVFQNNSVADPYVLFGCPLLE